MTKGAVRMEWTLDARLAQLLEPWYRANARPLPWRQDREPYHVWLSEIMLQQTRVEAVKGYYLRFLQALPTVAALAEAGQEQLNKLWEGLGYYTRVRNLQRAAQVIQAQHGGEFPRDYAAVRALPGIGDYTAGAICSICFDQPTPAVDGNVLRVAARLTGNDGCVDLPQTKRAVNRALAEIYPRRGCGTFTQSLMELGATVCLPNGAPACGRCPCAGICRAGQDGSWQRLPVRAQKRARREEEKTVFVLHHAGRLAVRRRDGRGLLAGLWEFPNVPGRLTPEQAAAAVQDWGAAPRELRLQLERSHVFTHVQWQLRCYYFDCDADPERFVWADFGQLAAEIALPTAFRMFYPEAELLWNS